MPSAAITINDACINQAIQFLTAAASVQEIFQTGSGALVIVHCQMFKTQRIILLMPELTTSALKLLLLQVVWILYRNPSQYFKPVVAFSGVNAVPVVLFSSRTALQCQQEVLMLIIGTLDG